MGKKFSKKTTKKYRVKLLPRDIDNIIEKEFGDSRGNKTRFRIDFRPHSIEEPTIDLKYEYSEENKWQHKF